MAQSARIIGIPGAGKTTRAMEIIEKVRLLGYSLSQIGFCTFTRAARREASQRAADAFGASLEELERDGWFRTLHSACARLLRLPRGSIVNHDQAWLESVLKERIAAATDMEDDQVWTNQWHGASATQAALMLWDAARNRLCNLEQIYTEVFHDRLRCRRSPVERYRLPVDIATASNIIARYESAKERDGRLDFVDILLRYAGIRMQVSGPQKATPQGDVPAVPVWIFDEAQDTSPLLDLAARRLSENAIYTYLFGDREQGIYGFAGADPMAFMRWDVQKQEYLHKTWRCARRIIELGHRLICRNDDIATQLRALCIEPRCEGGTITEDYLDNVTYHLDDPARRTLVMARTNNQVADLQRMLTEAGIPWKSVRTPARWPPLANMKLSLAFETLQNGQEIDGSQWRRIVGKVPKELLFVGTKTFYKEVASAEGVAPFRLASMTGHGGREALAELIASGRWTELLRAEEQLAYQAQKKYGAILDDPPVQLSTIHGSKGLQADKVILATAIAGPVVRAFRSFEGENEERRVWYVGATRARDELVLLRGRGKNYEEIYDCL